MYIHDNHQAKIYRNTRVLCYDRDSSAYYLTNDEGSDFEMLRVFAADKNGKIFMEGRLMGSVIAHDAEILYSLEEVNCTFEELNPHYFDARPVTDGLLGLSVGDAFGVPFEFLSRKEVRALCPHDMLGNDCQLSFHSRWSDLIPRGAWSDDTSMTIAAMDSIVANNGSIDYDDVMQRFFRWWEKGEYCSLDFPFGLGNNISHAMNRYRRGYPALECGGTGFRDNGNGALMRMFPFSMYCILKNMNDEETLALIRQAAALTHAHEINLFSCYLYTQFLFECFRTKNPIMAYHLAVTKKKHLYQGLFSQETIAAHDILLNRITDRGFDPDSIPESGYVADSLTIAVYSIFKTDSYEDAVKTAVSFGYDTDTDAAITGSAAGVLYGMEQIPERWLSALRKKEELIRLSEQFERCLS